MRSKKARENNVRKGHRKKKTTNIEMREGRKKDKKNVRQK